jgi:hypothetical protein
LPELTSNGFLNVQIEKLRLNGQTTIDLVEILAMVTNLTTKVTQLQSDNTVLKAQISELQDILSTKSCHTKPAAGTLSSKAGVMSYKDVLVSNQHQQARNVNTSKSYKNVLSTIQKHQAGNAEAEVPAMERMDSAHVTLSPGNPAEDGFITMTMKKHGDIRTAKSSENNKIG